MHISWIQNKLILFDSSNYQILSDTEEHNYAYWSMKCTGGFDINGGTHFWRMRRCLGT